VNPLIFWKKVRKCWQLSNIYIMQLKRTPCLLCCLHSHTNIFTKHFYDPVIHFTLIIDIFKIREWIDHRPMIKSKDKIIIYRAVVPNWKELRYCTERINYGRLNSNLREAYNKKVRTTDLGYLGKSDDFIDIIFKWFMTFFKLHFLYILKWS